MSCTTFLGNNNYCKYSILLEAVCLIGVVCADLNVLLMCFLLFPGDCSCTSLILECPQRLGPVGWSHVQVLNTIDCKVEVLGLVSSLFLETFYILFPMIVCGYLVLNSFTIIKVLCIM